MAKIGGRPRSATELFERCRLAQHRRAVSRLSGALRIDFEACEITALSELALPYHDEATDAHLNECKGLFEDVARSTNPAVLVLEELLCLATQSTMAGEERTPPDGAILLLHVLSWPSLVASARAERLRVRRHELSENTFPLVDVARQLAGSEAIVGWCRSVIAVESGEISRHHPFLLEACLTLLLEASQASPITIRFVLLQQSPERSPSVEATRRALIALFRELGTAASRREVSDRSRAMATITFANCLLRQASRGASAEFLKWAKGRGREDAVRFFRVLQRARFQFDDDDDSYELYKVLLGGDSDHFMTERISHYM